MSIDRHETSRGVRWEVRYRGPDRKERTKRFKTEKEAKSFEREQATSLEKGKWLDPKAGNVTLAEYAVTFETMMLLHLRRASKEIHSDNLRLHVLPTLGSVPLNRLTPEVLRSWFAALMVKKVPGTKTGN